MRIGSKGNKAEEEEVGKWQRIWKRLWKLPKRKANSVCPFSSSSLSPSLPFTLKLILYRECESLVLTETQKKLFTTLQNFLTTSLASLDTASTASLQFPNDLAARDKKFLSDFSDELKLVVTYDEFNDEDENLITIRFDEAMIEFAREEEEEEEDEGRISTEEEEGDESSEAEEIGIVHLNLNGEVERQARKKKEQKNVREEAEWQKAIRRVLKKYERAEVQKEFNEEEFEKQMEKEIQEKMVTWKSDYYKVSSRFSVSIDGTSADQEGVIYRRNSNLIPSKNRKRLTISLIDTSRDCNGSCTTTIRV